MTNAKKISAQRPKNAKAVIRTTKRKLNPPKEAKRMA
jgi:hypothetical protein